MRKLLPLLLLLTACSSPAPTWTPPERVHAQIDLAPQFLCQRFVQNFYDWYTDLWNADGGVQDISDVRALNLRPQSFSPELTARLMQDAVIHRKDPDAVTLDTDPFLTGRYYAGSFTIASINMQGGHCFADMYDAEDPKSETFVTAELQPVDDDWVFVNFHYPQHKAVQATDLLATLKSFQDSYSSYKPVSAGHHAS
jgi:hypothetical protein